MRENYKQDLNKKTLNELIQLFHEERVVEKLVQAQQNGGIVKVYSVYAELKTKLFGRMNWFKKMVQNSATAGTPFINDSNYEINAEDSLQVCLICIMSNINEITLLKDWFQLPAALKTGLHQLIRKLAFHRHQLSHDRSSFLYIRTNSFHW